MDLRQRPGKGAPSLPARGSSMAAPEAPRSAIDWMRLSVLVALALGGPLAGYYVWSTAQHVPAPPAHFSADAYATGGERFTREQLRLYDGSEGRPLYLAIFGQVFDVSKGARFYGVGGSYRFFTGIDASAAFATGKFSGDGLTDDVSTLSDSNVLAVWEWVERYHADYRYVGRLLGGYFYSASGAPTPGLRAAEAAVERARAERARQASLATQFPGCNMRRAAGERGEFWCDQMSGGIERADIGWPRELFDASSGRRRCACVPEAALSDPRIREYAGCAADSRHCYVD